MAINELDRAERNKRLIRENQYDTLTGLPNMSYFLQLADTGKKLMVADGKLPAMLYFDLKGMKFFNEKYGLKEGDNLLIAFANVLEAHFTKKCCGRMGQDHFAAFGDLDGIEDKILAIFKDFKHVNDGMTLPVHTGVYPISFEDVSASTACDRAKLACDKEKGVHVCTYAFYDAELHKRSNRVIYVLNNFEKAIEEKWIKPYYQPIIRSVNGKVCDEEALARWIDPTEGMIPPDEFIYVLEDAKLIHLLDLHIVEMVLADMNYTKSLGLPVMPVSVNISKYDFQLCDIVGEILKRVRFANIDPSMITLEVTESASTLDKEFLQEQIAKVHAAGFQIWMDDFGSGYSSLNMLQSFDFDTIKFDMRFMREFSESKKNHVIMKELVQMITRLDIDTIIEGVETIEQAKFLREIGANKMQGYYWGKPNSLENKHLIWKTSIGNPPEEVIEARYYDCISKANLIEPDIEEDYQIDADNFFGPHPMGVIEIVDGQLEILRYNKTYAMFLLNTEFIDKEDLGTGKIMIKRMPEPRFMATVAKCFDSGKWERLENSPEGKFLVDVFLKAIGKNELTGAVALQVVIVSISNE